MCVLLLLSVGLLQNATKSRYLANLDSFLKLRVRFGPDLGHRWNGAEKEVPVPIRTVGLSMHSFWSLDSRGKIIWVYPTFRWWGQHWGEVQRLFLCSVLRVELGLAVSFSVCLGCDPNFADRAGLVFLKAPGRSSSTTRFYILRKETLI